MIRAQILAAVRAVLVLSVICGLAYPLAVTGAAQAAFSEKADGSLLHRDGRVVGSTLLGQSFTGDRYFHPRPSAAGRAAAGSLTEGAVALSLVASGASNLGPTNKDLLATVAERVDSYREANGLDDNAAVPVDAVTASGSGVDPHISPANARLQAGRVAKERDLPLRRVLALVERHTEGRSLGFLGEEGVNVLMLNLALDDLRP
jgi:K+-transporting ATPase ATPase C chain